MNFWRKRVPGGGTAETMALPWEGGQCSRSSKVVGGGGGRSGGQEVSQAGRALQIVKRRLEVTPNEREPCWVWSWGATWSDWSGPGRRLIRVMVEHRAVDEGWGGMSTGWGWWDVPMCRAEMWGAEASCSTPWVLS